MSAGTLGLELKTAFDPLTLPAPTPGDVPWDRVAGMMVGLAIGDSLGNTSESMTPADRRRAHGEIRDYLPNWHTKGRRVGLPSDDTQLAFRTLEHLLEDGELIPERLADALASGPPPSGPCTASTPCRDGGARDC